jgi:hypothetical protein
MAGGPPARPPGAVRDRVREVVTRAPAGLAAAALPLVVYLATLLPGVGHSGDSAELSMAARLLAVPHPTGYPLYIGLVHVLGRLLPVSPALAANAFSALCAVAALFVCWRVLRELGARTPAALAAVWTLAFSPTLWRHAVVAEVYALHALLLALAALLFIRWARHARERDFYAACAVYALAFGNHLLMATALPAVVVLVMWVRPRAFLQPARVAAVAVIVALCASQYALVLARGAEGAAPYRAEPIDGVPGLVAFVTGAKFHGDMFAFGAGQLWGVRLRDYVDTALQELAPLAFFAPLGVAALGRTPAGVFLLLAYAGNLAFALGYDISDLPPYFIPNHLLAALVAGVGLDALLRRLEPASPRHARAVAVVALVSPLALAAVRLPGIVAATGRDAAAPAAALLDGLGPETVLIAEYHHYQFLLYYRLAEGRAPDGPHLAHDAVDLADVAAYLRDGRPLELPHFGLTVPPGYAVYSQKIFAARRFERAGLRVEPWHHDLYRLTAADTGGAPPPGATALGP